MQCEDGRTASPAKAPHNFPAAVVRGFVALQLGGRCHLQILAIDAHADVEGASVRSPAILAVTVIGGAQLAGIPQADSAAKAGRFEIIVHDPDAKTHEVWPQD